MAALHSYWRAEIRRPEASIRRPRPAMAATRATATRGIPLGSMGQPAKARSVGTDGPPEPDHRGTECSDRAGSGKESCGAVLNDTSWRSVDRSGFRADHWGLRALSLRQPDCELSGTGAVGRLQRESATAGTHYQAGRLDPAVLAGGSSPGHGA